ncbi:DNA-binding NarL/FixJ family response regulator [Leucobacter exalbidus]|uniref:DNA-binding NarL/FixJ family response regulator n=1 Tax=Leucobacter exalbidus TaxID=662960 RepID=A0A940PSH3_9MICO|nr:response regulator transcription factor [Leucobacter exalbidus]MBP1325415.1 DNA-binding NarL/FixJ family response regulator [Leucobacter exalbidus]
MNAVISHEVPAHEAHTDEVHAAEAAVDAAAVDAAPDALIRVVIVDDHQIFRTGLRAELTPALDVVGEAATVDEAVTLIPAVQPDVVLLDVHLPGGLGGGGAEVLQRLVPHIPAGGTRFLALSVSDAADDVVSVIRAGARGYLTKTASGNEVIAAVGRVHAGDAVFSPRLAGFVLDAFGVSSGEIAAADDELDRLSAREQEVMRMIARGYTYKEVAAELFLSVKTIETHVSKVLRKLQLSNRHELTAWALSRRLL